MLFKILKLNKLILTEWLPRPRPLSSLIDGPIFYLSFYRKLIASKATQPSSDGQSDKSA